MLNIKKIESAMTEQKITKARLCSSIGIARTTLDAILNGGDAKFSTIESISKALNVSIGYLFDEDPKEHYEATGSHGIVAKNIGSIDNREIVDVRKNAGITAVEEISEEIVLPKDCPEEAKHIVDRLSLEVEMLKRLLSNVETRLIEKDERIAELKERIEELKRR